MDELKKLIKITSLALFSLASLLAACQPGAPTGAPAAQTTLKILAVETFLAEITQHVAGDRASVEALVPLGLDPHAFESTPRDVVKIAESQVLIANGAGFEAWLAETVANASGERLVIEASAGLKSRRAPEGEEAVTSDADEHQYDGDPHFWLDPNLVIHYVENIRDGLIAADPQGKDVYSQNAAVYIAELQALDGWIAEQVAQIPPEKRLLVTNHESFGYFADRYGFRIIGAVIPSVSTNATPSAQQMAQLIEHIRATGAQAIFLETGANPRLAEQIAAETGVKVVTDLYTHSITEANGAAPSYIAMMQANVRAIVNALR